MKGLKRILCSTLAVASMSALTVAGTAVSAEDNLIYGTMNIPYDEFYKNEGVMSEVDAVSSATTGKWCNENLTAGTYNKANADGTGTILGVTYNVALTKETLNALGNNNYNFKEISATPQAYKLVTANNNKADFSEVIGTTSKVRNVETSINTSTAWGDYLIDVSSINNNQGTSDLGTIYGVLLTTNNGDVYGMRHLQNIWRDEIAWSSGFKTSEPHGNTLDYEDYVSLMGQTIDKITYITETGYHIVDTDLYVPIKFNNTLKVENSSVNDSSTTFEEAGFPQEYSKVYSVDNLDAVVDNGKIQYSNAIPGSYTLSVSDSNGIYDTVSASFVISTDNIPVSFDGKKLVAAENYSAEDVTNYIKTISKVTVDGKEYPASGRGSVKIFNEDGTINLDAASRDSVVFDANKQSYEMKVSATGYNNDISFTFLKAEVPTEENTENTTQNATQNTTQATSATNSTNAINATGTSSATVATTSNNSQANTKSNNNTSISNTGKVATGSSMVTVPVLFAIMVGGAVVSLALRKKKNN